MNKILIAIVAAMLATGTGWAVITGSAHDFTAAAWGDGTICRPCHAPHNAANPTTAPLWDHANTTETFTMYTSSTMDSTAAQANLTISIACLSCHDGVTNMDAYDGAAGTTPMGAVPGNFGTDLSDDHPIGMDYTASGPEMQATTNGYGGQTVADYLWSNIVECASCHDVHNGTAYASMLVEDPAGSVICLGCHAK